MITNELYSKILINPAEKGSTELFIVSGYASATFARRHILQLSKITNNLKVNLIIGMPSRKVDHNAYLQLHKEFGDKFRGYYLDSAPPVHSKVFSWYSGDKPKEGYSGSANYSQYGFFRDKQINQMVQDDPAEIREFYEQLIGSSIFMPEFELSKLPEFRIPKIHGSIPPGSIEWIETGKTVRISFLDKQGRLPAVSGLNWGQREEKRVNPDTGETKMVNREPNQAYLSLKGDARDEGFLPERAFTFTLVTDDGMSFDCAVAQGGRKAIHSNKNNSEIGKYFRERLGLKDGAFVTVEDLERYGRTDYTISKIDDESFLLDFSKPKSS